MDIIELKEVGEAKEQTIKIDIEENGDVKKAEFFGNSAKKSQKKEDDDDSMKEIGEIEKGIGKKKGGLESMVNLQLVII